MEFPLSLTDLNTAEATPGRVPCGVPPWLEGFRTPRRRHLDACPVEFPLNGFRTPRRRHLDACPVEFPLSLRDATRVRHTRDTRERLRSLRGRFANALTTIAGQRLDPWTPTFKTRTLVLRIREKHETLIRKLCPQRTRLQDRSRTEARDLLAASRVRPQDCFKLTEQPRPIKHRF